MRVLSVYLGTAGECPRSQRLVATLVSGSIDVANLDPGCVQVLSQRSSALRRLLNLFMLLTGQFDRYITSRYSIHNPRHLTWDAIICHDLLLLPAVLRIGTPVMFDAREYYPGQFSDRLLWRAAAGRLNKHLVENYATRAAKVVTVSEGLQRLYRNYGLESVVVPSYTQPYDLHPNRTGKPIRMVHHGVANPNRNIDETILLMDMLGPGYELHLYLKGGNKRYIKKLKRLAEHRLNVFMHKPVAFDDIVPELSRYDIGVFLAFPSTPNLKHSLPNKLFEFIQARLMLFVAPLEDAARLVRENNLGVVSKGFRREDFAYALSRLNLENIDEFKRHSDAYARTHSSHLMVEELQKVFSRVKRRNL